MIYKGKEIEDRIYVSRETFLRKIDNNRENFSVSELHEWIDAVADKTAELKEKGVDIKGDVKIKIISDDFRYNPNGENNEPYMDISLVWLESETEKESKRRIELKKRWIDLEIEQEQQRDEMRKKRESEELEKAIKTLELNGYKITK